jgi:RNA polymerase sigma-70 factor (ECF subfamily)
VNPFERPDPDLDVVLLAQRRATRAAAMGILYERFRERIYNVALRIVLDREEAKDVLQDVILILFRKIGRFSARAAFASWVYRITVNMSLDHVRRRRRGPIPSSDPAVLDRADSVGDLTLPELRLSRRDLQRDVEAALAALSERLRVVVVLRYLEGLAYADIAEILGCSVGTVKSRLNRAHSALRRDLALRYDPEACSDALGA